MDNSFDESWFMRRSEAEADDTIDLHENDDPGPRYKRLLTRLVEQAEAREEPAREGE